MNGLFNVAGPDEAINSIRDNEGVGGGGDAERETASESRRERDQRVLIR
jgi:hypothetical protein